MFIFEGAMSVRSCPCVNAPRVFSYIRKHRELLSSNYSYTPLFYARMYSFVSLNSCSFRLFGYAQLTTDLGGGGGALELLEEEKRLGLPAVNKVDLPTDGLNDREAN